MLCHGNGNSQMGFLGGCCFVRGEICPNRWYVEWISPEGEVFGSDGHSLGSVDDAALALVGEDQADRDRVASAVQGVMYACSSAILAVNDNPSIVSDRVAFEAAWAARPEYQPIADAWEQGGQPRNYCMVFGPSQGQCCFGEDHSANDVHRDGLSDSAVYIRSCCDGAS